jgi:hypothetical protein
MRGPINVKSPNNITNWQMRINSAFKGLNVTEGILKKSCPLSAKIWSAHIGDWNRIELQAVRNSVLKFMFPYK